MSGLAFVFTVWITLAGGAEQTVDSPCSDCRHDHTRLELINSTLNDLEKWKREIRKDLSISATALGKMQLHANMTYTFFLKMFRELDYKNNIIVTAKSENLQSLDDKNIRKIAIFINFLSDKAGMTLKVAESLDKNKLRVFNILCNITKVLKCLNHKSTEQINFATLDSKWKLTDMKYIDRVRLYYILLYNTDRFGLPKLVTECRKLIPKIALPPEDIKQCPSPNITRLWLTVSPLAPNYTEDDTVKFTCTRRGSRKVEFSWKRASCRLVDGFKKFGNEKIIKNTTAPTICAGVTEMTSELNYKVSISHCQVSCIAILSKRNIRIRNFDLDIDGAVPKGRIKFRVQRKSIKPITKVNNVLLVIVYSIIGLSVLIVLCVATRIVLRNKRKEKRSTVSSKRNSFFEDIESEVWSEMTDDTVESIGSSVDPRRYVSASKKSSSRKSQKTKNSKNSQKLQNFAEERSSSSSKSLNTSVGTSSRTKSSKVVSTAVDWDSDYSFGEQIDTIER